MTALVPFRRPDVAVSEIKVGAAVRGFTWRNTAELAHWARGRGMMIVPAHYSGRRFASGTETFRYKLRPSQWAIQRIWAIHAHATGSVAGSVDITIGTTTLTGVPVPTTTWLGASPILVQQDLAAKINAINEDTIAITRNSGTIQIDTVSAFEVPRFSLDQDTTEYGVTLESLFPQDVIYDAANASAHAVAELVDDLNPRRVYFTHSGNLWSTSSASYQPVFEVEPPIFGMKLTSASQEQVTWDVYARITAAGDADVQIVTNSGNSKAVNLTNTSFAWIGTSTVDVNVEDPSTADGLPSATWETIQINGRVNSGGGDLEIREVSVWKDS